VSDLTLHGAVIVESNVGSVFNPSQHYGHSAATMAT